MFHMSESFIAGKRLLQKYLAGEPFTESEQSEFDTWRAGLKYHRDLPEQLKDPNWVSQQLEERRRYPEEEVWVAVLDKIEKDKRL